MSFEGDWSLRLATVFFFLRAFGLPLLLLMGIGPLIAWRRTTFRSLVKTLRWPVGAAIVAGVALGTILTVAAIGFIPPRPAPDLCWYWADPYRNRGYWDYCY